MKIVSAEVFAVGPPPPYKGGFNWMFVKLGTDDGIVGWGEANMSAFRHKAMRTLILELCDHFVIGRHDPFNSEQLWSDLTSGDQTPLVKSFSNFRHTGSFTNQAAAAIEMACWDIVGKRLGQPVHNLLGGRCRNKLRTYTYLAGWIPGEPPQKAAEAALAGREKGFTAFKLDPIPPYFPQGRGIEMEELRYVETVFAALRDALGTSCDLMLGTHGQLNTHSAIRLAKVVEPYQPLWFEEPVPPENPGEMARVAQHTSIPVAAGERLSTKWDFHALLERQAVQVVQPNVSLNGILESKKIAALAEVNYAQVAPWIYCGPIAAAAAVQLDLCTPNFLIQEGIDDWGGFAADLCVEPLLWEAGYVIPSDRPGLGVELDESRLKKHPANDYDELRRAGGIDKHKTPTYRAYRAQLDERTHRSS